MYSEKINKKNFFSKLKNRKIRSFIEESIPDFKISANSMDLITQIKKYIIIYL